LRASKSCLICLLPAAGAAPGGKRRDRGPGQQDAQKATTWWPSLNIVRSS
jgi:hypothetical protein